MNDIIVTVLGGKDYRERKTKKERWIKENGHQFYYSNAYCQDDVFVSQSTFAHAMDVEDRFLDLKHQEKILMPEDFHLLSVIGSEDSRIIWTLKESLIKENSLKLYDLINGDIRIHYLEVRNNEVRNNKVYFQFKEKKYFFCYENFEDKVLGFVSETDMGRIIIRRKDDNDVCL